MGGPSPGGGGVAVASERDIRRMAARFALLAFGTYLAFLLVVLALSARSGIELYMANDSETYIAPARNILEHGSFSRETHAPYLWEPYRTPGYPLMILAFLAVTGKPTAVLAAGPLLAAFVAYTLVRFTWDLFRDRRASRLAGFAAAFFPNGLGLSVMVLTDFAHGCFFLFALWATYRAIRDRSPGYAVSAAVFWMSAQLIRPTLSVAFVLIIAMGIWLARDRWQIMTTAALTLASFAVPMYLSWQVLQSHGVFVPSLQGVRQTLAPWDWIVLATVGRTVPILRVICAIPYLIFLALALMGTRAAWRRVSWGTPAILWLVFLFWIGTGSFNFFAGARYRFPGDLTLIPLAALGVTGGGMGRRGSTRRPAL
ncbi:MAG: glycosyltransferase family 39 protein [Acidobacteria bacterium]|nr:glycosyltransferase family 39 protein [Acidobacteriota bacterium]